jgi:hypothetical protein
MVYPTSRGSFYFHNLCVFAVYYSNCNYGSKMFPSISGTGNTQCSMLNGEAASCLLRAARSFRKVLRIHLCRSNC